MSRRRFFPRALAALTIACASAIPALASRAAAQPTALLPDAASGDVPATDFFAVGERLRYAVTIGRIRLGTATLRVEGVERHGGTTLYRTSLEIDISAPLMSYRDRLVSWIEPIPFRSLAFMRRDKGEEKRMKRYTFDPDRDRATIELRDPDGGLLAPPIDAGPTPENALDELAALFFLRSTSLAPGETRTMHRYIDPSADLMEFTRLADEKMRVPAGRFETTVYRAIIPALPAFRADRDARIYVAEDVGRPIVMIETETKIGRLKLYLTDRTIVGAAGSRV